MRMTCRCCTGYLTLQKKEAEQTEEGYKAELSAERAVVEDVQAQLGKVSLAACNLKHVQKHLYAVKALIYMAPCMWAVRFTMRCNTKQMQRLSCEELLASSA